MAVNIPLGKAFVEIGLRGSLEKQLERERQMALKATQMIQDRISEFTAMSARVFAAGTAAITGFVAAASPDAIATFTGSIRLLSGEIGRLFIPVFVKAIQAIQQTRNFIRGLSDETKSNIVQWTLWGIGIAGAIYATSKLIAVLQGLFNAAVLAAKGIAFLYANPVLAGLASLAAALAIIAINLHRTNMEAAEMAARAAKRFAMPLGDVAKSPEFQSLQQIPEAKREQSLKNRIQAAEEEVKKATSALANVPLMRQSRVLPALLGFGPTVSPQDLRENLERAKDHLATLRKIQQASRGGVDLAKETRGVGQGLLTAFTGPQPQFFAIEQLSRQLQLAVLGPSPLEAEQQRMELENNELFRRIAANTDALPGLNLGAGR